MTIRVLAVALLLSLLGVLQALPNGGLPSHNVPFFFGVTAGKPSKIACNTTTNNSTWAGTSSATVTVTTVANSVLLITAHQVHATITESVASVTSANLTYALRGSASLVNTSPTTHQEIESWWAFSSGAHASEVVTVTSNGTPTDATITASVLTATNTPSSPFDANVSLPTTNTSPNSAAVTISGLSTNSTNQAVFASIGATGAPGNFTSFTACGTALNLGTLTSEIRVGFRNFQFAQTNATFTGSSGAPWVILGDAMVGQ